MPDILIQSKDFESWTQKDYIGNLFQALMAFGFEFYDRDSFIDVLILCIREEYFEDLDSLKQKVQEVKWEY